MRAACDNPSIRCSMLGSNRHQEGVPHGSTLATVADLGLTRNAIDEGR